MALVAFLLIACERNPTSTQEKSETRSVPKALVEKEKVEIEEPLPFGVKIKLRRDGKDNY